MPTCEFVNNDEFSKRMQAVAIVKFYLNRPQLWPGYSIIEVDNEFHSNHIARALDIGGTDKLLRAPSGYLIHLGQRFRRENAWYKHCELTIRDNEYERHVEALNNGGTIPDFYSYGFADKEERDFIAFFVIKYRLMMSDVQCGRFNLDKFERREEWQHNFYKESWPWMPPRYIHYSFINVPFQPMLTGFECGP